MSLKSIYYSQCPSRANDAIRIGYYLIARVSKPKTNNNKQEAYATAYWYPQPTFEACLAVKINLSSLSNRLSDGLKEISYKELEGTVIHIESNNLEPSQNPSFSPTYKIVWNVLGPYVGPVNPVEFLTDAIRERWEICDAVRKEVEFEVLMESLPSEYELQELAYQIMDQECTDEENSILADLILQEEEENENNQIFLDSLDDIDYDNNL
ncbi:hypothetical protein WG906_08885 [Pedobacter sp. P351]|uniref:hypothetical protein n=1 Tax=Pedobacter superstes TaxID=3133441 RepID=UPI0030A4D441